MGSVVVAGSFVMCVVLILALATASISITVAKGQIFELPRTWLKAQNAFLGELFSCPYCVSHWVTFAFVAVYRPRLVQGFWPLDLFISAMVIVALAMPIAFVIYRSFAYLLPPPTHDAEVDDLREALVQAKATILEQQGALTRQITG